MVALYLESHVPSCQAVPQLVLVSNEGHEPHVGLYEDGLLQHQDSVGFARDRVLLVSSLRCLRQLIPELVQRTHLSELVAGLQHWVLGEGAEWKVPRERVPARHEGWLPQSVPENAQSFPFSLVERLLWKGELPVTDAIDAVQGDSLNVLTAEHDEVILADQEGVLCKQHNALLLIVPMIHLS